MIAGICIGRGTTLATQLPSCRSKPVAGQPTDVVAVSATLPSNVAEVAVVVEAIRAAAAAVELATELVGAS